jgi:hypothetical protein
MSNSAAGTAATSKAGQKMLRHDSSHGHRKLLSNRGLTIRQERIRDTRDRST